MNKESNNPNSLNLEDLQDLVTSNDSGGRDAQGLVRKLMIWTAIAWSIFQLYYASPFPYDVQSWLSSHQINLDLMIDDTRARSIHLAFAIFLAFLSYPASMKAPRHYVPWYDWTFALIGAYLAMYYLFFYDDLFKRVGAPITQDIIACLLGIALLLEATRRSLGLPLVIIASCFLAYNFLGQYLPFSWRLAHNSGSLTQIANTQWLTSEGVFGTALSVSTKYVFVFVLFGSLLDKAGAGNYFIKTAFAFLGHLRGGPAKAAIVASGLTGLISGSSIANVVTTGTFTIPMMKKVGFSAEKAGAVEVSSSVNGQIMPPVMGAAAFLIAEYTNMPYSDLVKHAFLPAVISYIALVYIVHLEACKANLQGLPRRTPPNPVLISLLRLATVIVVVSGLGILINWFFGILKNNLPEASPYIIIALLLIAYFLLIRRVAQFPDLDSSQNDMEFVPETRPTLNSGLHYLIPVVILMWLLMVEQRSTNNAAFWAMIALFFIQLTQRPLLNYFRKESAYLAGFKEGLASIKDGLEMGARNMIGIGIATACAGIIVGVVSLTDFGSKLSDLIEILSFGNLVIMLILVAIFSLILGMGLPTTANYIVVSTLMTMVIIEVGAKNGLIVPLVAVHLFVFYFGIMADVTPPVGLASFAAAAISGGDPIKTGLVSFVYSLRTALLPFLFIFNTDLLLIDVNWLEALLIFAVSVIAILSFTASTMNYFLVKNKWYEALALLLVTAMLFRPGFFMDYISPSENQVPATEFQSNLEKALPNSSFMLKVKGLDDIGRPSSFYVRLDVPEGKNAQERLENLGINLSQENNLLIEDIAPDSSASKAGLDWDQEIILAVFPISDSLNKRFIYIPALLLLAGIFYLQNNRRKKENHG